MSDELDHDGLARWSKRQFDEAQKVTRGTPIEKLDRDASAYVPYTKIIDKINELIDRLNRLSEVPRV